MIDGPRALRPEELPALAELVDPVFRRDTPGGPTMADEYPHLFTPDNAQNLRVVLDDGRVVSHVGTTIRNASVLGCSLKVGQIGAVSTHPDYRGRGYAGACFDDACANAKAQGADFMMTSGDRALYRRSGCRRVGLNHQFRLASDAAPVSALPVRVERAVDGDLDALRELYRQEPVRILRPLEDWQHIVRGGRPSQHNAQIWVVRHGGSIVAYAALFRAGEDGSHAIEEYAGDRAMLVPGLQAIMQSSGAPAVRLNVQSCDAPLRSLLTPLAEAEPASAGGTQHIIHFTRLMVRLRPLIEERVGRPDAGRLSFRDYNGRFTIAFDADTIISTDRGGAAQFVWGAYEPPEWDWQSDGTGKSVLQQAFPIPALEYGFSYV